MEMYTLQHLSDILNGKLYGDGKLVIQHLLIDSRNIPFSDETLFIAIVGERNNGHQFTQEAYHKGIKNFLVSDMQNLTAYDDIAYIKVKNTLEALQQLAVYHRSQFSYPVIGVTGSNGKTIVKEWLFQSLNPVKKIVRSPKSYNSQVGVPLSIWLMEADHELGIFEAGISEPGEMDKLQAIIRPDIGIFTNIGPAHQENFRTVSQKITEKLKLFTNCRAIIYSLDHQEIHQEIIRLYSSKNKDLFTWSAEKKDADIVVSEILKEDKGTRFKAAYNQETQSYWIPFTDRASFENAVHVLSVMLYLGLEAEIITTALKQLSPVAMRLEVKKAIQNCTLINDSYNSDLNSLAIALDALNHYTQYTQKTVILSDIQGSGLDPSALYAEVDKLLKQAAIQRLIGIGTIINKYKSLFSIPALFYSNTNEFLKEIANIHFSNEAILLKGARTYTFERISQVLEFKLHQTRLAVNLDAIIHNLNYFKSLVYPETKIMVMVKAFSYGNGGVEIASLLQHQNVAYLGVAYADEGVELRNNGINMPVMIMNPSEESYDTMIQYRLEPEIYSFKTLQLFHQTALRHQETDYPVHIKLDTGMNRLGFSSDQVDELIDRLIQMPDLKVVSVFSHLAASDEQQHDEFTKNQIDALKELSKKISDTLSYPVIRHILNSAGIERFPEGQMEMVRLGIGIYGISLEHQEKLMHVGTLKTVISQIRHITPAETIGYSRKGNVSKESRVAVLPIGYADGYNRRLGNGHAQVLINKKRVSTIGNICMDMCMVDITEIDAKEGDEVILFGEEIPIQELACILETIPYEILTSISARVNRVFFKE